MQRNSGLCGRRDEDASERPALGWFDWQWRRLGYQAPSAHRVMSTTIPPSKQVPTEEILVLRSTRRLVSPSVGVRLTYALAVDCVFLLLRRRHWTKERRHEKVMCWQGRQTRPAVPIRMYFSLVNVSHFYQTNPFISLIPLLSLTNQHHPSQAPILFLISQHAHSVAQSPQEARSRPDGPRPYRQAPQASRWSR